ARDASHLARFQREGRMLAALNHPNIASIYGVEETDGNQCLVLELVQGATLAERLRSGPLPLDEALDVARQVAEALAAAHEKGIPHRDLKPANVKLRPDGRVKILDFGLAKDVTSDASADGGSDSPTLVAGRTEAGVVLGTVAYMSPEQLRGKEVDRRTDIWAFGCVLYELLTGRRLSQGETRSDIVAWALKETPDWRGLPHTTPPSVRRVLDRCLRRDARERLQHAGDARIEIEQAIREAQSGSQSFEAVPRSAAGPAPVTARGVMANRLAVVLLYKRK